MEQLLISQHQVCACQAVRLPRGYIMGQLLLRAMSSTVEEEEGIALGREISSDDTIVPHKPPTADGQLVDRHSSQALAACLTTSLFLK